MENNENAQFYREKAWEQILAKLKEHDTMLGSLEQKIDHIDKKVTYIYAFSGGAGAVAAFVVNAIMK